MRIKYITGKNGIKYEVPCDIKNFGDIPYCLDKNSLLLNENNEPFYYLVRDDDLYSTFLYKIYIYSGMISKGIKNGLSMEIIRNTYGLLIQALDDKDIFDCEKAMNLSGEEIEEYFDNNPELNFGKRYQFVFDEERMEQIYLGLINGVSADSILKTYCKFEIEEKTFNGYITFKYKEPLPLYDVETMSFARSCLEEGLDVEKVEFLLSTNKDFYGRTFNLFTLEQMEALKLFFENNLSISDALDSLIFEDRYIDGILRKICICTKEEIIDSIELFKEI